MPYRFSGQPRQWKRRPQNSIPFRSFPLLPLNPLFEREWRGRFRRPSSYLQLGLLVALMAALVCVGVWQFGFAPGATVQEWRSNGRALLNAYRWLGALVFWGGALLMGVTTVSDEKAGGTWEHLLLCPTGGRGLAVGKIASGAAWLLMMQGVLLPPLLVAGRCFGVSPPEIAGVMVSHLLLTIQGTTLGLWGALRGRTLIDSVAQSLSAIGRLLLLSTLAGFILSCAVIMLGQLTRAFFVLLFPSFVGLLQTLWAPVIAVLFFAAQTLTSLMAGLTGLGVPLLSFSVVDDFLQPLSLLLGQFVGLALFLKWSAWGIDYPTRDFWGMTPERQSNHKANDHLRVLYRVWRWELTPHQVECFPLWERQEPTIKPQSVLPTWEQAFATLKVTPIVTKEGQKAPPTNTKRMRAPVSRRWQELNPVLWLDLTRCLSLRSPDSAMLPVLLTVGALGGSLLLAVSLFLIVGWVQSSLGGKRGDVSSLSAMWDQLHWFLWWSALGCGPVWGALSYVIERRTGMLVELRLTLITALAMWMGKFWARFGIFAVLSIPLLSLVAFFAWNWPDKNAPLEVMAALISSWSLGAWSVCACLWLSDSCRRDLAAALWCGAFGVGWGLLLWNLPTFSWTPLHLAGAALTGGHLFWRLKRLGFG